MNTNPDLSQRPPRSPRVRLGGYVILARILDKGRAELAGAAGEYKYNNPIDRHWFRFTGITPEMLKAELASGKGDGEILAWVRENTCLREPSMNHGEAHHSEAAAPAHRP